MAKHHIIGAVGAGAVSLKATSALLDDYIDEDDAATFVLPVTPAYWSPALANVAKYAVKRQYNVTVVTDDTTDELEDDFPLELIEKATNKVKVAKVVAKVINDVAKADDGVLLIAWDEEVAEGTDDAGQQLAMTLADQKDIVPLNLCDGLDTMTFYDDTDTDTEVDTAPVVEPEPVVEEVEPEPEKPVARKRAARKVTEPEPDNDGPSLADTIVQVSAEVTKDPLQHVLGELATKQGEGPRRQSGLSDVVNPLYGVVVALIDLISDEVAERVYQKLKENPIAPPPARRGRPPKQPTEE